MSEKKNEFEESLQQLSELVNSLDNDALSIERSLLLYEQGMQLVDQCQSYLNQSKARIEKVHKDKNNMIVSNTVTEEINSEVNLDSNA